jgi:hypothetical protein
MPVHDWTRVEDGIFHAFHHLWITSLHSALNRVLPPGYYALPDQVAGPGIPDVLSLQRSRPGPPAGRSGGGTTAVAAARVRFQDTAAPRRPARRKRIAVRHVTGNRVVALVEVVSPSNRSGRTARRAFARKLADYLDAGVHLLVLDLFPPGRTDPNGLHPLIWSRFKKAPFALPPDKPLTLAAYAAGPPPRSYVEPVAVGDRLPDMPLFLTSDSSVDVPLEATYRAAWDLFPPDARDGLEPTTGSGPAE